MHSEKLPNAHLEYEHPGRNLRVVDIGRVGRALAIWVGEPELKYDDDAIENVVKGQPNDGVTPSNGLVMVGDTVVERSEIEHVTEIDQVAEAATKAKRRNYFMGR